MQVKLVLKTGSQAGKAVLVNGPKCLIGRGEECQVRPQLDAISRKHCLITVRENEVVVRDLKSRNGTFVNNEAVKTDADTIILNGDILRVGPIEFEVSVDQARAKKPVVKGIKDVALRTAGGKPGEVSPNSATQDLSDVDRWLSDEDDKETSKLKSEPETRQFRLDDTSHSGIVATGEVPVDPNQETKVEESKKKEPGKLPPRSAVTGSNSREAAADMLKKLFNRR